MINARVKYYESKVSSIDEMIKELVSDDSKYKKFTSEQKKILNHSLWSYRREVVEMSKIKRIGERKR